uniref:Solute carrier family 35 member G1 n=1 Tax=Aceria tosichella TaxID=561515 RepID=A0A6G1S742_9ACAR
MAPDDLKFVRMEARLQEQQLIMAELGQLGKLGSGGQLDTIGAGKQAAEASANIKRQQEDPTMIAMINGVPGSGSYSYVSGSGAGDGDGGNSVGSGEPKEAPDQRPLNAARQYQKYGACETAAKPESSHDKDKNNNNNNNNTASGNFMMKIDEECLATLKKAPDGSGSASATIGGNKFVAAPQENMSAPSGKEDPSCCLGVPVHPAKKKLSFADSESGLKQDDGSNSKKDNQDDYQDEPQRSCIIQRLAKVIPCFGILLSLGASVFLGTAGMLVKLVESVHGIEVAVFRAIIQLVVYSSIIWFRGTKLTPSKGEVWPVAGRAILGGTSITFSYYALKLIPLGDATTIRFSLPIWTLIMSYFFLNESCTLYKVAAVMISISGVVLVTKPDDCIHLVSWLAKVLFNHDISTSMKESSLGFLSDPGTKLVPVAEDKALHDIEEITMLVEAAAPPAPPLLPAASGGRLTALSKNLSLDLFATRELYNNHNNTSNYTTTPSLLATSGGSLASSDQQLADDSSMIMVASASQYSDPMRQVEGCLMALASSVCLAMSIIALRMCRQTPSEVSIFWMSAVGVAIGTLTLLMLDEWALPNNLRDCLFILLNGACGSLGQWFMTNALKVEQSGLIALARTFDIEVAFLYSALLLGEQIRPTSIIGSVLVSLGVITVLVPRWLGCGRSSSSRLTQTDGAEEEGVDNNTNNNNNDENDIDDHERKQRQTGRDNGRNHTRQTNGANDQNDETASTSGASSNGPTTDDEEDQSSRLTVTTVLNGLSTLEAGRRSLDERRSIEYMKRKRSSTPSKSPQTTGGGDGGGSTGATGEPTAAGRAVPGPPSLV